MEAEYKDKDADRWVNEAMGFGVNPLLTASIFSRKQDAYSSSVNEDEEKGLDGLKKAEKM